MNDAVHSKYVLQETVSHTMLTDVLEIHFLDLQANLVLRGITAIHGGTEKPFEKRRSRYEA